MKPERIKLFLELTEEIGQESKINGGFLPKEVWLAINKLVPRPVIELIVTRNEGREFLLVYRRDEWWDGWHVPGGYMLNNETIEDAANRMSRKDLGIGVAGLKVIGVFPQLKHPYYGGSPLSIIIVCGPIGEIEENVDMRFFDHVPEPMIFNHAKIAGHYLEYLKYPEAASIVH